MTDTRSLNSEKMANQKVGLTIYRIVVYIVLFFLTLLCLFPFYVLLVNCSREGIQLVVRK